MSKGLYLFEDLYYDGILRYPGVFKKIQQQADVLQRKHDITLCPLKRGESKVGKRIPLTKCMYEWPKSIPEGISFIYLRRVMPDRGLHDFLKLAQKQNIQLILELPVYPYDKEQFFNTVINYPLFIKDAYYRREYKKYIQRIVTNSDDEKIFGIETIRIKNGIDVNRLPVRKVNIEKDKIRLLSVSCFQPSHGYERVLVGLHKYIENGGKRKIEIQFIGNGEELQVYKKLVERYGLKDSVLFIEPKEGEELNEVFNNVDIGLEVFGLYKRDIKYSSSLKSREYLARGLPFVGGNEIDLFQNTSFDYCVLFPNDNSPIDMNQIIDFYDKIYANKENAVAVTKRIRAFAEENASWDITFKPVIDYLDSIN